MSAPESFPAFPLAWPARKARTKYRERAKFGKAGRGWYSDGDRSRYDGRRALTVAEAMNRLQRELDLIGAKTTVLSSNLALRIDGCPRSGQAEPSDPGVALYFRLNGEPIVLAVDRYDRVADNIAALAAHLEASRAIERYGVGTLTEIFAGYAALPAQAGIALDDWRGVLGEPQTLAQAEAVYRERMRTAHPDHGGSESEAARLNAAIARAREVMA